jgi:hypothetical protein
MRRLARAVTFVLLSVLGIPATSALPTDAPDIDGDVPRQAGAPSVPSVWDSPAAPPAAAKPPPLPAAAPEHVPSANPLWAIPLATLSGTRERPIFSPSRRPPPPIVASVPVTKPPPPPPKPPRVARPQLSLVGTIAGDDQSFAIFVDQTTKAALRLKIGEEYQGWKLHSVQGREVTLERDQQSAILSLPQPAAGTIGQVRAQAENAVAQGAMDALRERGGRR